MYIKAYAYLMETFNNTIPAEVLIHVSSLEKFNNKLLQMCKLLSPMVASRSDNEKV